MKIFKYQIPIQENFSLNIPKYSSILSFQLQNDIPCIWVVVHENQPLEKHNFSIYGTGYEVNSSPMGYQGTIQLNGFVWHLFLDSIEEVSEHE